MLKNKNYISLFDILWVSSGKCGFTTLSKNKSIFIKIKVPKSALI